MSLIDGTQLPSESETVKDLRDLIFVLVRLGKITQPDHCRTAEINRVDDAALVVHEEKLSAGLLSLLA